VIWQGLVTGVFDVFSSDHAGYRYNDAEGKMKHGRNAPFKKVANGVPGLEVRTALLFSEGVGKGRIDLPKFVALTATNAAKLYGLYPRKGTIAVGSDADLAIWDPHKEVTIKQSMITTRWITRPTKAERSQAGRSPRWCAEKSSPRAATSSAPPAKASF
jgi:dihydropyrimidinase